MQREVQRVVEVVVEVRAGRDDEVDQATFHQLDHRAAEPGRREGAGDGEGDGGVVLRRQHLVGVDAARLAESRGVERLEPLVDERADLGAAARPVVADRASAQVVAFLAGGAWSAMGHGRESSESRGDP